MEFSNTQQFSMKMVWQTEYKIVRHSRVPFSSDYALYSKCFVVIISKWIITYSGTEKQDRVVLIYIILSNFSGNLRQISILICSNWDGFLSTCRVLRSLFQALGQWGRSKKRAGDKRDQRRAGSGREKERAGEPVSIVLKTSFRPLETRNGFMCQKCQVSKSPYVQYRVNLASFT